MGNALTAVLNFCKQPYPSRIKKCSAISSLQENMQQTVSFGCSCETKSQNCQFCSWIFSLKAQGEKKENNKKKPKKETNLYLNIFSVFQAVSRTISAIFIMFGSHLPTQP